MGRNRIYPQRQVRVCEVCQTIFTRKVRNKAQAKTGFCCSNKCKEIRRMRRREAGITTAGRPRTNFELDEPAKDIPRGKRSIESIPGPTKFDLMFCSRR